MQTTAHDIASYVLQSLGPMRSMKLQKIIYYGQAWSLAWSGNPLFAEPIQAWKDGPITRALWNRHKGLDVIRKWNGNPDALSIEQKTVLNRVFAFYGRLSGNDLSTLTHAEKPWIDARRGLQKHEPGTQEISHEAMREYYRDANLLVNSGDLQEMVSNLVRKLPSGEWGTNLKPSLALYSGYAAWVLAPMICKQAAQSRGVPNG